MHSSIPGWIHILSNGDLTPVGLVGPCHGDAVFTLYTFLYHLNKPNVLCNYGLLIVFFLSGQFLRVSLLLEYSSLVISNDMPSKIYIYSW